TGRLRVRERVRHRRQFSGVPPPNWSAQTRVLPRQDVCWHSQSSSRAAGETDQGLGQWVSLRPTIQALGTSSEAGARAQGWAGILSRAIVAIGSHSLAL